MEKHCPNCGNTVAETDKFCDQCGHTIEHKVVESKDTPKKKPSDKKKIKQIADHLEFLGYTIKFIEPEKEGETTIVTATHEKNNNFIFWQISSAVFFQMTLKSEKRPTDQVDKFINQANQLATLCRVLYFVEEDGTMRIRFEAMFVGEYTKPTFNDFVQLLENDQKVVFSQENFNDLFV